MGGGGVGIILNSNSNFIKGAPLAQLVECWTLDQDLEVVGSNYTRGAVLCP